MKLIIYCALFFGFNISVSAQCDDDLTAKAGTYLVTMNQEKVDSQSAPYSLTNCYFLELIESNRKLNEDVTLELGNYIIKVYSKNRVINSNPSEQ